MACVKKAKANNHTFPFDWVLEFCPESAANQHGRVSVFFPAVVTCRSLRPKSGRCEGGLAGPMKFAMPARAHTAGQRLSPPDSDCGTERSAARAGGRRSHGHAQRSEVKRSEPDGVRPLHGGQSVIFSYTERKRNDHSLPTVFLQA
jgi:hypothetical protein